MSSVSLDEDAVVEVGADCPLQRSIEAIGERLTAIEDRFTARFTATEDRLTSLERDLEERSQDDRTAIAHRPQ
jgi:hypothetical protein